MKKCTKIFAAIMIVGMLSACGNEASQTQGDGSGSTGLAQSQGMPDSKESEPSQGTSGLKEPEPSQGTSGLKESEPSQETPAPQEPEPSETPAPPDDGKCTSSAKHFSSCEVTVGDSQIKIDFVNNVPSGEVDGFFFYLWDNENATAKELDEAFMDSINSWYQNMYDTTYTFSNLTNGQTYHLYALVYLDNWEDSDGWKFPEEGTSHDAWYIGAYTPGATDNGRCTSAEKHFSACEVTPGDGQLKIDFINNVPVGESHEFYFYLLDSEDVRVAKSDAMDRDDTTYTFTNLTNGQTYDLYAFIDIDNWEGSDGWKFPEEGTFHDVWHVGTFTPAAN